MLGACVCQSGGLAAWLSGGWLGFFLVDRLAGGGADGLRLGLVDG